MYPLLAQRTNISHARTTGQEIQVTELCTQLQVLTSSDGALSRFFLFNFFLPLSKAVFHSKGGNTVRRNKDAGDLTMHTWLCHKYAVWVWASYFPSLCLSFSLCEMKSTTKSWAKAGSQCTLQWIKILVLACQAICLYLICKTSSVISDSGKNKSSANSVWPRPSS